MTIQTINIGNVVNDGLGDDLRTAFQKVNSNFSTLGAELAITVVDAGAGSGVSLFKAKVDSELQFKTLSQGRYIELTDTGDSIYIKNNAPDAFFKFDTDSGVITAGTGNTLGHITIQGAAASNSITGRKDIEVTTNGTSILYVKNTIPVVDILTIFDFGPITEVGPENDPNPGAPNPNMYNNVLQFAISNSNVDFGTITLPGRLNLDCGFVTI